MTESNQDAGVIAMLIERLETQRLPRALDMKAKVDHGECLDEFDLAILEDVFAESAQLKPLLERHPECEELAGKMMALYVEITEKGLANEKTGES